MPSIRTSDFAPRPSSLAFSGRTRTATRIDVSSAIVAQRDRRTSGSCKGQASRARLETRSDRHVRSTAAAQAHVRAARTGDALDCDSTRIEAARPQACSAASDVCEGRRNGLGGHSWSSRPQKPDRADLMSQFFGFSHCRDVSSRRGARWTRVRPRSNIATRTDFFAAASRGLSSSDALRRALRPSQQVRSCLPRRAPCRANDDPLSPGVYLKPLSLAEP